MICILPCDALTYSAGTDAFLGPLCYACAVGRLVPRLRLILFAWYKGVAEEKRASRERCVWAALETAPTLCTPDQEPGRVTS